MARESWVKKEWKYIPETGASGWFPVLDPETDLPVIEYGNVQVDYVWGNYPLQPDDDRDGNTSSFGGGSGDAYWNYTSLYNSDTLQTSDYSVRVGNQWGGFDVAVPPDSHTIASTGWDGYPGLDLVPNVVRLNVLTGDVADALSAAGMSLGTVTRVSVYSINGEAKITATDANRGIVVAQYPKAGDGNNGGTVNVTVLDPDPVVADTVVPDVVGLDSAAAQSAIEDVNLVYASSTTYVGATTVNDDTVKTQSVPADTLVDGGSTVSVVLYAAPLVPDVTGLTESAANTALVTAHLVKGVVTTDYVGATTVNDAKVKSQSLNAGDPANTGSAVDLVLYAAPVVPDLTGLTESAANTALVAVHLLKGTVTTSGTGATAENDGTVKSQSVVAGAKANTGSAVNIVLYLYTP